MTMPSQYTWQFADEGTSNQKDTTFSFNTAGERIVSLVAEVPGCNSDPTYDTILINPTPDIDFDYTVVCEGLPTQFGNTSASQNLETIHWDFGDGYFNTSENPEHLFETHGAYEVTMSVVDEEGCTNDIQKTVSVDQIPSPGFSVQGNVACAESEITFIDETDNTVANVTEWLWEFGDGETSENHEPNSLLQ